MTRARSKSPLKSAAPKAEQYDGNYNAASWTDRRIQYFGTAPKDARTELTNGARMTLLRKSRYAEKNHPPMAQYALDMVTYTVGDGIMPNSHAKDPTIGEQHVRYYLRKKRRPDVTGKFSYSDIQKVKVHTWSVDGEAFVISVDVNGETKEQIVEGHRSVNPAKIPTGEAWSDGFLYGEYGQIIAYNFRQDDGTDQRVEAARVRHICKPTRASAGHGLPPLAQALNIMQDQAEIYEMEALAVKDVSDIPRVITKAGGTLDEQTAGEVTGKRGKAEQPYADVSRKMGGKLLVLDVGEKLEYPVPTRGTATWIGFNDALSRSMCGGGLPYEFVYDASKAGSAVVRMNLGKAGRYIGAVQTMLIEQDLEPDYIEVVGKGIAAGEIPDDPNWMDVSWTVPPAPSIDNGRDAANDREDLKLGLNSYTELFKTRSKDFRKDARQQASDLAYIAQLEKEFGLPVNTLAQRYNAIPSTADQVNAISMPADEQPTQSK